MGKENRKAKPAQPAQQFGLLMPNQPSPPRQPTRPSSPSWPASRAQRAQLLGPAVWRPARVRTAKQPSKIGPAAPPLRPPFSPSPCPAGPSRIPQAQLASRAAHQSLGPALP